jgi:hypothetical protein
MDRRRIELSSTFAFCSAMGMRMAYELQGNDIREIITDVDQYGRGVICLSPSATFKHIMGALSAPGSPDTFRDEFVRAGYILSLDPSKKDLLRAVGYREIVNNLFLFDDDIGDRSTLTLTSVLLSPDQESQETYRRSRAPEHEAVLFIPDIKY